ncbi:hypothetical protein Theco_4015 (plasmid) [Thermobacillus composti KWC4]|jgi:hypothetical protein|uniref:Uncharacterized protein n=1 Tax=Thermobacillus composti (strain DSM 18247 / JCM 13945 / KWC4) TaxID=717605 RepID=L0EK00_THECK|nr:hypothetical protein [Thermobacillus composti]AGA60019.1 hypothetical protein Theco_4015 [Thermobacillus composti KWC4]
MYQFYDPSLYPIVTTDLEGNILNVKTRGLYYYGIPDFILEEEIDDYETLFYALLDKVFKLEFDINETWSFNGKIFRFEVREDGFAHIVFPKIEDVKIVTIINPFTGKPAKFRTKGLSELFNHPEAETDGETIYGKEILGYLAEQVKEGEVYDEDCTIFYENFTYGIDTKLDREGKPIVCIKLVSNGRSSNSIQNGTWSQRKQRPRHLNRIK